MLVVTFAGHVIVGLALPVTTTVWSQDEVLPALSVAVQWIVVDPAGKGSVNGLPSLRLGVGTTALSQLSDTVGTPGETLASQVPGRLGTEMFAGQVIAGAVVSLTVNEVVAVAVLPPLSFAVSVIVCCPSPTIEPASGSWVTSNGIFVQSSEVVAPAVKSGTAA